jgi:hypothetical protein
MTDPIAIRYCIQCPILTQYQTTQMISLDYVSTFELGPFSANILYPSYHMYGSLVFVATAVLTHYKIQSRKPNHCWTNVSEI